MVSHLILRTRKVYSFPTRDYITHLINQGKIDADVIAKNADNYKELTDKLDEMGVDIASLDKDMLLSLVDKMSDEQLMRMRLQRA